MIENSLYGFFTNISISNKTKTKDLKYEVRNTKLEIQNLSFNI